MFPVAIALVSTLPPLTIRRKRRRRSHMVAVVVVRGGSSSSSTGSRSSRSIPSHVSASQPDGFGGGKGRYSRYRGKYERDKPRPKIKFDASNFPEHNDQTLKFLILAEDLLLTLTLSRVVCVK
eukprot:scaffold26567_cov110-Skeletonema_menzelii.AAC.1